MGLYSNKKIKIWVDDIRTVPSEYGGTKSVDETLALIEKIENDGGKNRLIREDDILTNYLQKIEEKLEYKHWYFGHYHNDKCIDDKHTLLYYAILELES